MTSGVPPTFDPASADARAETWRQEVSPRLDHLADFQLPSSFPFDFSRSSLHALEAETLARFSRSEELASPDERGFVEGTVAYLGETLLRVGGGRWVWDKQPTGFPDGLPAVRFDSGVDIAPVTPLILLHESVRRQRGDEFTRAYDAVERKVTERRADNPGWTPAKIPTPAVDHVEPSPSAILDAWLADREAAFPRWAADHHRPGGWDFSAESLHDLETLLLGEMDSDADMLADKNRDLVDGATWYLGEIMVRVRGGKWYYTDGEPDASNPWVGRPYVRRSFEDGGDAIPPLSMLRFLLRRRRPGTLYDRFRRFGP
jgi:hypothetical protein